MQLILQSIHQDHLHLNTRYICSHSVLCHLTQTHKNFWFSVCFPYEQKNSFYICYFQHRLRLIQRRGKFCPHHTFFFPPTLLLSLFLCSSVTPKSFGSTPGLAPALNIVQLHGRLRFNQSGITNLKKSRDNAYVCLEISKIWEEGSEENQTSHKNMISNSWIYGQFVVIEHQRVTRLCLCSLCVRNMLLQSPNNHQTQCMFTHSCAMTRTDFMGRERKRANFTEI